VPRVVAIGYLERNDLAIDLRQKDGTNPSIRDPAGLGYRNGHSMHTGAFMSHSGVVKERYVYRQSYKNRCKSQAPRVSHSIDEPV
jgi:hypothetical protein